MQVGPPTADGVHTVACKNRLGLLGFLAIPASTGALADEDIGRTAPAEGNSRPVNRRL
jgi:hypothetical protein